MELLTQLVDIVLHLDRHLAGLVAQYGTLTYVLLFLIIFCETGLVVTPILPGDSLLFATGALAATGPLDVWLLFVLLAIAAILGDTVNYWVGAYLGLKVFREGSRIFRPVYLERTNRFFEKYGGKTIILGRFVPIVRTFAPFVAGACRMTYPRFVSYNIIGGIIWIGLLLFAGYFFGNVPIVQENFGLVIIAIIIVSLLPAVAELWSARRSARAASSP